MVNGLWNRRFVVGGPNPWDARPDCETKPAGAPYGRASVAWPPAPLSTLLSVPMVHRLVALLVLAPLIGACSLFRDEAPSAFEARFSGGISTTLQSPHTYTRLFRYTGIGTGDGFAIVLRSMALDPMASIPEWTVPDSVVSIHLFFSRAEEPDGVYVIEGQPWAGGSFWAGGRWYVVHGGTVTVARQRGRLVGTFQFTDTYLLGEGPLGGPSDVRVEGRFDVARSR